MALRAFSCNPSLGGFGSENVAASAGRRRPRQEAGQPIPHQDQVPTTSGDTRSIQSANRNGSNAAAQGRQHMEANYVDSYDYGGGGGDAFAQILKELVDNAVDACCAAATGETSCRTASTTNDDGANGACTSRSLDLKRVRVVIEPVVTSSGRGQDEANEASTAPTGTKKELLRVSVNDNGVGMSSIEDCVEAFRTSKRSSDRFPPNNSQSSVGTGSMSGSVGAAESQQPKPPGEGRTAGRYGIGLTLCLLHSQRLCPNSVASITSATADAIQWTRASYVVDTEGDRVRCVKKELLDKKAGESGTMVSLLVPGGSEAAAVWPRLAEYFARFQLSDIKCSLEVKAPTLSTVPLYIRPTFEMKHRQRMEKSKRRKQIRDTEEDDESGEIMAAESQSATCKTRRDEFGDGNASRLALESDDDEWDDGLTVGHIEKERRYASSQDKNDSGEDSDDSLEQIGQIGQSQSSLASSKKKNSTGKNDATDTGKAKEKLTDEESPEDDRREFIQKAASSYLNRQIELKNVAHAVNPIRRGGEGTSAANQTGDRPMLEVDMVVYGRGCANNDHSYSDGEESATSSNVGDEFDAILDGKNYNDESGEAGKLILIRMVNRIPLLDGAEASSCGLVRGISKKKSTWNSYGLEVSPLIEDRVPCVLGNGSAESHNEIEACIPTYHLKDSAQVAPFFRSNSHALYESDSDDPGESDSDEEDGSDCSYDFSAEEEKANARNKRKRKKRAKLLPCGIRIGNMLVIAQIHANPSALPLPTLSKGRLPMNDADIDDALEIGLSSCLRSLQRSNPDLLLTANQLKRTERDVRYLPAIAASLASIIKKSSNTEFRSDVYGKVMSWRHGQPKDETEHQENIGDDNSSTSSKSSIGSEQALNESMDRLSALRLTGLIEDQLRYCISDENKQRKKDEERERKLEARRKEKARKEKAKQKLKQKQRKKSKTPGKRKNAKVVSGGLCNESDSDIDLDDLLLEGESEEEEMEYSEDSNDSSVLARRARARRIRDLAFIGSDDESSTSSNSTNSSKSGQDKHDRESYYSEMEEDEDNEKEEESDEGQHAEESDFSEDETILRPSECNLAPRTKDEEVEEKKDDDFDDGFDNNEDGDDDWL